MSAEAAPPVSQETIERFNRIEEVHEQYGVESSPFKALPPTKMRFDPKQSSLGNLDTLPPEIQLLVFDELDFLALCRLQLTSRKGKAMVEYLLSFNEMMVHSSSTLVALAKTDLLEYHSAKSLRLALRSWKCVSCSNFGHFLFLLTCERVCFVCQKLTDDFWLITPRTAKKVFSLKDEHLTKIPAMETTRLLETTCNRTLICAKQARNLAVLVHGSEEAVAAIEAAEEVGDEAYIPNGEWNQETREALSLELDNHNNEHIQGPNEVQFSMSDSDGTSGSSPAYFLDLAASPFPSLSAAGLDHGSVCRGCESACSQASHWNAVVPAQLIPDSLTKSPWNMVDVFKYWTDAANKVFGMAEYVEHIKCCQGVQQLLDEHTEKNNDEIINN